MKRANVATPKPPTGAAAIDLPRHHDGFVEAAVTVRALVARMTRGKDVLQRMATDHPDRPARERLWQDLATRLHEALRSAYARYALIRVAIGADAAQELWDRCMPSPAEMEAIEVSQLMRYWRGRTDRPEWITHQEDAMIKRLYWPPEGTHPDGDVINQRLQNLYEEPPF